MDKKIWLPKSEMTVSVSNGKVEIYEKMTMTLQPIKKPPGFQNEK